jgi:hypothetical protein
MKLFSEGTLLFILEVRAVMGNNIYLYTNLAIHKYSQGNRLGTMLSLE